MKVSYREIIHHGTVGLLVLINTISVKYMLVPLSEPEMRYVSGTAVFDYYQNFRGILLFCACAVLLLNLLAGILSRTVKLELDRYSVLLVGYMAVAGLSFAFSPYRLMADEGFMETYEGVSVLISYGILAFTMAVMPLNKRVLKFYTAVFMATFVVVTGISLLQYIGADPLRWPLVKGYATSAFMPTEPPENGYGLAAHGFFSNPNYLSSYFSLLLPGVYFAFLRCKNRYSVLGLGLLILCAHLAVFASGSVSGLALVAFGMIVCWRMTGEPSSWRKEALWHLLILLPMSFFVVKNHGDGFGKEALFAAIFYMVLGGVLRLFPTRKITARRVLPLVTAIVIILITVFATLPSIPSTEGLTRIEERQGVFQMTIDGQEYSLSAQDSNFEVLNGDKSTQLVAQNKLAMPLANTELPFQIEKDTLQDRSVYKLMPFGICFEVEQNKLFFLNSAGRRDTIVQPRFYGPEGYGRLGNSRMYIWQHALPLLAEHPVLGTGPDTFGLVFPQNDVVNKVRYIGNPYALATKAHNSYLNYAVNLGLAGMLIFIGLQFSVLQDLYKVSKIHPDNLYVKPLFGGLLMFALMGLANDSRIFLAVYHWALMGISISLIRRSNEGNAY